MAETFAVVAADPPWKFRDKLSKKRGAASQYKSVMTLDEMKTFALPPLRDDAALFIWRVAAMESDARELMAAWGFTYKSELVWIKLADPRHRGQRTLDSDDEPWAERKRRLGMGRIVRHEHEICLIGVRGKPKILDRGVRSTFRASAGRHSEKPVEFFHIVERLYAGPYVELFARQQRDGWTCIGNEVKP